MSKKRRLDIEYSPEFRAIAIFTAQKGYRLCWLLNQHLHTAFSRMPDFIWKTDNSPGKKNFPVFGHENPLLHHRFYLLANKVQGQSSLESPANMDFLLLIKNPSDQFDMSQMLKSIRSIPQVNTAVEADTILGKTAGNLFYDFEMYLGPGKDY